MDSKRQRFDSLLFEVNVLKHLVNSFGKSTF